MNHANPRGGSRQIGVGVSGLEPRNQSLMTVMNFPMGLMAELMSAVVLSGICDRHSGIRFVLEEAGVGCRSCSGASTASTIWAVRRPGSSNPTSFFLTSRPSS